MAAVKIEYMINNNTFVGPVHDIPTDSESSNSARNYNYETLATNDD